MLFAWIFFLNILQNVVYTLSNRERKKKNKDNVEEV